LDLTEFVGSARASSHDGTSAYQLRMGLFRVVCTNGLIVSKGAFPAYCVSHRGNVVDEVIEAALKVSEQFETLAVQVERMEQRRVMKDEQLRFAERALALRYPDPMLAGMQPSQLLNRRRPEGTGDDLWTVMNRVQLCRAPHNCSYVAMRVMWRTLLQQGQIRFLQTSPPHNLGQNQGTGERSR
jgi:Domain of unknown function (DUF932)